MVAEAILTALTKLAAVAEGLLRIKTILVSPPEHRTVSQLEAVEGVEWVLTMELQHMEPSTPVKLGAKASFKTHLPAALVGAVAAPFSTVLPPLRAVLAELIRVTEGVTAVLAGRLIIFITAAAEAVLVAILEQGAKAQVGPVLDQMPPLEQEVLGAAVPQN